MDSANVLGIFTNHSLGNPVLFILNTFFQIHIKCNFCMSEHK